MDKVDKPHDKLFRETMSSKAQAVDFFSNYLPRHILDLIDMDTLEISKDSFIEEELNDFYSDILYEVTLKNDTGYIYLLFEHKSYTDAFIQFQLFGYIYHIYKLYVKQTKAKRLPIVLPIVFYHGESKWNTATQFSSIIQGPVDELRAYIPDFSYILFDLTRYSDDELKGGVILRTFQLLLKHSQNPDFIDKLPHILKLVVEVITGESGLKAVEAFFRYVFSTIEDNQEDKVKEIIVAALSHDKGGAIMGTIAERWINEGEQRGMQQGMQKGMLITLLEGIEMDLDIKFGSKGLQYMDKIRTVKDIEKLKKIMKAVKLMKTPEELNQIIH